MQEIVRDKLSRLSAFAVHFANAVGEIQIRLGSTSCCSGISDAAARTSTAGGGGAAHSGADREDGTRITENNNNTGFFYAEYNDDYPSNDDEDENGPARPRRSNNGTVKTTPVVVQEEELRELHKHLAAMTMLVETIWALNNGSNPAALVQSVPSMRSQSPNNYNGESAATSQEHYLLQWQQQQQQQQGATTTPPMRYPQIYAHSSSNNNNNGYGNGTPSYHQYQQQHLPQQQQQPPQTSAATLSPSQQHYCVYYQHLHQQPPHITTATATTASSNFVLHSNESNMMVNAPRGTDNATPAARNSRGEVQIPSKESKVNLDSEDGACPVVRWSDVVGQDDAVEALKQAIVLPVMFPHFFTGQRKPWRSILMYGPPGTGKTLLAQAAANEARSPFFSMSASDLLSKWVGESEKQIRSLFDEASRHKNAIIFLDEIDALCSSRKSDGNESESARRIKTEFLVRMQQQPESVLMIAATNLPWELDSAFLRRFDHLVFVSLPTAEGRKCLLLRQLGDTPHGVTEDELDQVVKRLEGYSSSDIVHVVRHALMRPVQVTLRATHFKSVATPCPVQNKAPNDEQGDSLLSQHQQQHILQSSRYGDKDVSNESAVSSVITTTTPQTAPAASSVTAARKKRGRGVQLPTKPQQIAQHYQACDADDPAALPLQVTDLMPHEVTLPPLTADDLEAACSSYNRSVRDEDIAAFVKWNDRR